MTGHGGRIMAISKTDSYGSIYGNIYENNHGAQKKMSYPNEVSTNQIRQQWQQGNRENNAVKNDTVDISKAGQDALTNKMFALHDKKKNVEVGHLSPISSQSMIDDFEKAVSAQKTEGVKTNTFDAHVNQMVSAYCTMKKRIEEKYADSGRKQEYYVADDGSIQELNKEKELEMLDRAYVKHSEFMAATTEIWNSLQDFKPQITYQAKNGVKEQSILAQNSKKGEIKGQAYQAFMSAVNSENIKLRSQEKEDFPFNFSISVSARKELNHIWDYYANIK